jgi:hypothetical protein
VWERSWVRDGADLLFFRLVFLLCLWA